MRSTNYMEDIRDVVRRVSHQHALLCVHVTYFLFLSMVGSLCLWLSPKAMPLSFTDAVFNAVSAVTETGLGSVEMHRFSLVDQITLLLLMLVGSQVFTSAIPLFLKRLYSQKGPRSSLSLRTNPSYTHEYFNARGSSHTNVALFPSPKLETLDNLSPTREYTHSGDMGSDALAVMSWVTTCYFGISIMGGFLICEIGILCSPHALAVLEKNQVNSVLFSLFSVVSAFGNCGYILLDDNLQPLQRSMPLLLCLCGLMLLGNTLYAPTMRLVICLLYKTSKGHRKQVYGYILHASERRYSHLFPHKETIWLVGTVIVINAFQMICILGLDWESQALKELGPGYKTVIALFQSIATRTGGMNAVSLSGFSSSTLLVFLVAMYIASYPINLTKKQVKKRCNNTPTESKEDVFAYQLIKFRAQDFFLVLATFLICIFERHSINRDPLNFSFFNFIFEVISGYGNVGLTIGYDCALRTILGATSMCMDIPCSFSGRWNVGSKMVLIVVMMLGRHKGLPKDIDWNASPSLSQHVITSLLRF